MDATFWVTISFLIFLLILVYFKIPQKIKTTLDQNITNIKNCDKHADQKTELDFTFFRKKATKNIPSIVP